MMALGIRLLGVMALFVGLCAALFAVALFASMTTEVPLWLGFLGGIEQLLVQLLPQAASLNPFVRAMILSVLASLCFGSSAYLRSYYVYLRQKKVPATTRALT